MVVPNNRSLVNSAENSNGSRVAEMKGLSPQEMANLFHLLGDPCRLQALLLLNEEDELSMTQMADILGTSLANLSKHMGLLRLAGLVENRRDGKKRYYHLTERGRGKLEHCLLLVLNKLTGASYQPVAH